MDHEVSSFLCGCAARCNLIFFAKQLDALADNEEPNSSFFAMNGDTWMKYDKAGAWPAISMAFIRPPGQRGIVVAIGAHGEFWEVVPSTPDHQSVAIIGEGDVLLRSLAAINNIFYACGMGRVVLRREAHAAWEDIGPEEGLPQDTVVGFEDIDGFSEDEIYAVGWNGEIWLRDKTKWKQIDSPVSANLNSVCCAEDGYVYVVGDNGVMVRGRHDTWSVLDTGRHENLQDVTNRAGVTYVVTDFRILKLQGEVLVNETDFLEPDNQPATCLLLLEAQDGLISMGPKDLFRRPDGGAWERVV